MTKQTKMLLGVGALAAAGYFLWKKSKMKPAATASFANASGSMVVSKGGRVVGRALSTPKGTCRCSPSQSVAGQIGGKDVYECCGNGMYAYAASPNPCSVCNAQTGGGTTTTTLGNFSGSAQVFTPTPSKPVFV